MFRYKLFCFLVGLFFINVATAQEDKGLTTPENVSFGKGNGGYMAYGFVVGPNDFSGANVTYGSSNDFQWGNRNHYKLGIQEFIKLGNSTYYRLTDFRFEQDAEKNFPTSTIYDKEKIKLHRLGFDLFLSFRFDKNLNQKHGTKLDLGGYVEWAFSKRHKIRNKFDNNITYPFTDTQIIINKKLDYIRNFQYGVVARLSLKNLTVYGDYRISNLFKDKYNFKDLPKIVAGLQINI